MTVRFRLARFGLLAALIALAPIGAKSAEFINILTGGTGGVYYPLGVALSKIYAEHIKDAKPSVQSTKASVENLNLLQQGKGEIAFTLGDSLADAWKGNAEVGFKAKLTKLRTLAAIYPNYVQIAALKSAGIKTLADLKGKRVSVGAPASGTELNARAIFKAAGLKYEDFSKTEYLPFGESVELMKNRQLDATLQSAGLGNPALRDLANNVEVVFIPIPPEVIAKIGDKAYMDGVIPANTYKGQTAAVPTAKIENFLVTRKGVSTDVVYSMTKAMYEHLDQLVAAHAAAKSIKLANAIAGMPIPLHPGAAKYYREVGLIKK